MPRLGRFLFLGLLVAGLLCLVGVSWGDELPVATVAPQYYAPSFLGDTIRCSGTWVMGVAQCPTDVEMHWGAARCCGRVTNVIEVTAPPVNPSSCVGQPVLDVGWASDCGETFVAYSPGEARELCVRPVGKRLLFPLPGGSPECGRWWCCGHPSRRTTTPPPQRVGDHLLIYRGGWVHFLWAPFRIR